MLLFFATFYLNGISGGGSHGGHGGRRAPARGLLGFGGATSDELFRNETFM